MKRILILGRKHSIQKEHVEDLHDELIKKLPDGYDVTLANYNELVFDMQTSDVKVLLASIGEDIASYDFVYMMSWYSYVPTRRDMAFSIATYLDAEEVPFVNSEALKNRSSSKISQMMLLALHGIKIPRTIFGLSKPNVLAYVGKQESFQAPYIVKNALASRGSDNFLSRSLEELEQLPIGMLESMPFIIQPFIPNDKKDWRVLIMDFKSQLIIERCASGDSHLNNTSQGGTATLVDADQLPQQVVADAEKVARLLNRDVTGVDVMHNNVTDEYFFLEANALPQLASGSFVDEKMAALAKMIVSTLSERSEV